MKEQMRVHYDVEGDFLEISVGKPTKCYATEIEPGVFIRKDEKTDKVKSISILGFKKRSEDLQDIKLNLPFNIQITA